jgi:PadR family transcriptional regulator PadR
MTVATARILGAFLADVSQPRYGYELMQVTGFASGKLFPILARLRNAGWLLRELEDIDPVAAGRPARWMYRLTVHGAEEAHYELALLSEQISPPSRSGALRVRPEGDRG